MTHSALRWIYSWRRSVSNMARSLAEHKNNHENDNLISELWLVELNPVCADKLAGFVTYWSSGKSVWSPCGRRKHTSSAGEQTSTEHRRSPLSESRLFFLVLPRFFYRSSSPPPSVVLSLSQCSVSTVIPVVSSSPGVSDWGKQCLFLLEMADALPSCRRTTFVY